MAIPLLKRALFNVFGHSDDSRLHVEVKGLGMITINRTSEGVIIDVHDKSDEADSIASLALSDSDFEDRYASTLQKEIERFDYSIDLDSSYTSTAYSDEREVWQAIEDYYSDETFDMTCLSPLKGSVDALNVDVRSLTRPYIKISEEKYQDLLAGTVCFFKTSGGHVVTFGQADGGFALMPLQNDAQQAVLKAQE